MSPVRILILLGLFYILFKLLIKTGKRDQEADSATPREAAGPPRDVLQEDPVCHTLVPARQAITLKNNGNTLYFCSSDCRSKFITTQGEQP